MHAARISDLTLLLVVAGCNHDPNPEVAKVPGPVDLAVSFVFPPEPDLYSPGPEEGPEPEDPRCGPRVPCAACNIDRWEHFALKADDQYYTFVDDEHVARDPGGGLRLQGALEGRYTVVSHSCRGPDGNIVDDVYWYRLFWDANLPRGSSVTARVRSGHTRDPAQWGANPWTAASDVSPLDLRATLTPNRTEWSQNAIPDAYVQVEFIFKAANAQQLVKLRSFTLTAWCPTYCPH